MVLRYNCKMKNTDTVWTMVRFMVFNSISTIFQLYRGGQFY